MARKDKSRSKGPAAADPAVKRDFGAEQWQRERQIQSAEVAFITDERLRPLEYWWEQLCSTSWPLRRFKARAKISRWGPRRDEYRKQVTQEILRQSKYSAVRTRVQELERLQRLQQVAYDAIEPKLDTLGRLVYPVPPKSLEGMIGAITRLDVRVNDARDELLSIIEPELLRETAEKQGTHFSPDDMRTVARVLLVKRREAQTRRIEDNKRRLLTEGDPDDDEDSEEES